MLFLSINSHEKLSSFDTPAEIYKSYPPSNNANTYPPSLFTPYLIFYQNYKLLRTPDYSYLANIFYTIIFYFYV